MRQSDKQRGKGNSIRQALAATVLVALMSLSSRGATQGLAHRRYVPGEVIVKLRTTDEGEAKASRQRDMLSIVNGLGEHRFREIRPLSSDLRQQPDGRRTLGIPSESRPSRRRQRGHGSLPGPEMWQIYRIRLDTQDEDATEEAMAALRRLPGVEYAERNSIISACAVPNDPLYRSQWALAKIDAAGAWDICRGTESIVVAVPDTGVDYDHRDLQGNLWINEAELNGIAGIDDDGNGYIDDIYGYDFIAGDSDPIDDNGHGTHCAGIIAARTDNALDVAGVSWYARIMPVKMLDNEGFGTTGEAIEAIYYAVANGADIISCSWGESEDSRALRDAVAYAYAEGVVLVAAAGNERSSVPFYPAAYAEVIGVAATEQGDQRQYTSSFGDWVDIAAPGDDILSLRAAGTSAGAAWSAFATRLSGTSMAAPHVSGACALLLSANPFLGPADVRQAIFSTVDPIAGGTCASNGRLNVAGAVQAAVPLRGVIGFDRELYREGTDIRIHLADRHLKGTGAQAVVVATSGGDTETVTLTETSLALGVFSAVLASEAGVAVPGDGRVQVLDGEWIVVEYLDADTGDGRVDEMATSQVRADYASPAVVILGIEPRGTSVRVTVATNEPAQLHVRYGRTRDRAAWSSVHDLGYKGRHRLSVGPLLRGTDYGLAITLTDMAGNETVIENDNSGQAFITRIDPDALLVPDMYRTIQAAIDAAQPGGTIWVADGTYSGSGNRGIDFEGKAIAVRSENGPEKCTINGRRRNYGFVFRNGESADSILDGFTISNGGRTDFGGGIQCFSSSPTITDCILTNNAADRRGGGIYCSLSSPAIEACTFLGNTAEEQGGALYCDAGSYPKVVRCIFEGNQADAGGAVSSATDSAPAFRQCLFFDNAAMSLGAAVADFGATVTLTNCTLAGNEAGVLAGGVWSEGAGAMRLDNCILWGNSEGSGASQAEPMQIMAISSQVEINYSCIQGWTGTLVGIGSFGLDPLFADPDGGDFHLRSEGGRWDDYQGEWVFDTVTSPCIDAGDPAAPLGDEPLTLPNDPTGTTINTRINLGAYGGTAEASVAPNG